LVEANREATMPLFFYLPLIIWTGLFGVVQEPRPVPVKVRTRR
jgi:hypothetical protein